MQSEEMTEVSSETGVRETDVSLKDYREVMLWLYALVALILMIGAFGIVNNLWLHWVL